MLECSCGGRWMPGRIRFVVDLWWPVVCSADEINYELG
jgi:hypothetical protein